MPQTADGAVSDSANNNASAVDKDSLERAVEEQAHGRLVRAVPIAKDTMILSYLPSWNHGGVDNIAVANNDGGVRTLFGWDALPESEIEPGNRRFYVAAYSRETTSSPPAVDIRVVPLADDWSEKTAWQNQPKVEESADAVTVPFIPGKGWKLFDVTPIVRRHKTDGRFGVTLHFESETQSAEKRNWSGYAFASREGLGEWKRLRPQIVVVEVAASEANEPR
jgi:hypothetical protein